MGKILTLRVFFAGKPLIYFTTENAATFFALRKQVYHESQKLLFFHPPINSSFCIIPQHPALEMKGMDSLEYTLYYCL